MSKITDKQVSDWLNGVTNFEFKKEFSLIGYKITFEKRSKKKNLWGRFGGGWNIKFGFQLGGRTLIIDIFVMSVRIQRLKENSNA